MSKILCFQRLPLELQNNYAFKCECVWLEGAQSNHSMCTDYNNCLDVQKRENSEMVIALKNMEKAVFLKETSAVSNEVDGATNEVDGRSPKSDAHEGERDCFEPLTMRLEE